MKPALAGLDAAIRQMGISAAPGALTRFEQYLTILLNWRDRLNLTAAATAEEIIWHHFLDSLVPFLAWPFPTDARVADVGSGAGFPGIPMKIVRPDLRLVLVEASRRRVAFLEQVRTTLELDDVEVLWGRAERLGHRLGYREAFTSAVSRAAARVGVVAELCLPLVEPGGAAVLLTGPRVREELGVVIPLIRALGGEEESSNTYLPPGSNRQTVALVLAKKNPTPPVFPRSGSKLGR